MLIWNPKSTPSELHPLLRTLGEEYPVRESGANANLVFERSPAPDCLRVRETGGVFLVTYSRRDLAGRGVAYALANRECDEKIPFDMFGILLDCTRGAVWNVGHFKKWLRRCALLGYNTAMLYTKDAYTLEGEPYFGYMRGAYTLEEMKEVDSYANSLGIEMIASIQALGHLEPILRWSAYSKVKDTDNVILADEPESIALVEKMIDFWSRAFSSRRIHLGMDETHDLGRGRFMDLHGWERPFDIYNRHLGRVRDICAKRGLQGIIWSDMYFRYANKNQDYYDNSAVPEDVKNAIPRDVILSYWDYYHRDSEIYIRKLTQQKTFNGTSPVMASGIWTWAKCWTDYEQTFATVKPCLEACAKTSTRDIIFTMWGDDGNYCEFDSALAGMAWVADCAFSSLAPDETRIASLFEKVCGSDYFRQKRAGDLEYTTANPLDGAWGLKFHAGPILWDDPLMGIVWNEYLHYGENVWDDAIEHYRKLRDDLARWREDAASGNLNHAWNLANTLLLKLELRRMLLRAYEKRDYATLATIAERYIPDAIDAIDALLDTFREEWMRCYKTWGFEVVQIKLAGLAERYRETARRIDALLDGSASSIGELEAVNPGRGGFMETRYRMIATGGWFI